MTGFNFDFQTTTTVIEKLNSPTFPTELQISTEVDEDPETNQGTENHSFINEKTSISNNNTLNNSNSSTIINESENFLLKIEIERLNSKINSLKNQPFSFAVIEDTDSLITYYTGLPNKKTISWVFDIFANVQITYFLRWNVESINRNDQILMTLMKLRLNIDFIDLGVRFGCSRKTVTNVVMTWIHAFHTVIFKSFMDTVPSQLKNRACLPSVFNNFVNCRMILDCTEIFTAIPSKMDLQKLTYSNYKHRNTLKGLVGIAPNGVLTFCSSLYPGSTSDKEIVKHSGVLAIFNSGDLILADKGFLISDLLPDGVSVNIPPFLGTPQFTPNQVLKTLTIAKARVHVERTINRIKGYSILEFIPPKLIPYSSKIFQVCSALTNFQYPLIKEVEMFYLKPKDY